MVNEISSSALLILQCMNWVLLFVPLVCYCLLLNYKGEKWWKAIIPIYGSWFIYKIFSKTKYFWITFICSFIACLLIFGSLIPLFISLIETGTITLTMSIISLVCWGIAIIVFVIAFIYTIFFFIDLCKTLEFDTLCTLGLISIYPIMLLIMTIITLQKSNGKNNTQQINSDSNIEEK